MIKYVPNILTVLRFFIIPFISYFLVKEEYILVLISLTLSGLTDILDGIIARKFNCISNFGKLIDPLADKTTQLAILFTLVIKNIIPFWILIIVIFKEFAMIAGASFLYGKKLVVSSKWYGKSATVLFYLAIVCSVIIRMLSIQFKFDIYLYCLAILMTIFSLLMYFRAFFIQGYFTKEGLKIEKQ